MNHPFLTKTGAIRAWWSLLMVLVAAVVVGVACITYTSHVQQQSDARFCPVLILSDRPAVRPPQTPDEVKARQALHKLRLDLGCGRQR